MGIGFDGCPACTFGEGRSCKECDYDCCSDCTFDYETVSTRIHDCPKCWCDGGTIGRNYWNETCNCEGHVCNHVEDKDK